MSTDGTQPQDDRPGWDAPRPGKPRQDGAAQAGSGFSPEDGSPAGPAESLPSAAQPDAAPSAQQGPPRYGAMTPDGSHASGPGAPTPPSYAAPSPTQPAPYGQPSPYGGYGQPGGYAAGNLPLPQPGPIPALPRLVNVASILLVVGAAIAMVQAILQAVVFSSMPLSEFKAMVLEQAPAGMEAEYSNMIDSMSQGLITSMVVTIIALYAVGAILAVLVAIFTRKGSNTWRIVGTVCGVLATLANLASFTSPLSLVLAVLGVLIVVFWWLPESNRWFAAIRRNKAMGYPGR